MYARIRSCLVAVAAAVLLSPLAVSAAPADHVPDDAILFVSWAGGSTAGEAARGTRFGNVLAGSKLQPFFDNTLPAVIEHVRREDPRAAEGMAMVYGLAGKFWSEPAGLYLSVRPVPGGEPDVFGALIIEAGDDAAELERSIARLMAEDDNMQRDLGLTREGGVVRVSFGSRGPAYRPVANPLGTANRYAALLQQVHAEPVGQVYLDLQQVITLLSEAPLRDVPPEVAARLMPALQEAGFADVQQLVVTMGFEADGMFGTRAFLAAPAPRRGFLKSQPSRPFDEALLGVVPKNTTYLTAARFDAAAYLQTLRDSAARVDERADGFIERGLSAANAFIGRNLTRDVLEPLGDEWVAFASPEVGGSTFMGLVVVNKLDDAAKARDALTQVAFSLDNTAGAAIRRFDSPVRAAGRSEVYRGARIYYLGTPLISPAWTVKGDYLILGFVPQNVMAVLDLMAAEGPSILENEKFKQSRAMLDRTDLTGMSFTDLEPTAAEAYGLLTMLMRGAVGAADMFGIDPPGVVMPPFTLVKQNLAPTASASWVSDAGFHSTRLEPFPASAVLRMQPGSLQSIQAPAALIGVLLPSLNRARETAMQVEEMSNLRQIGTGVILYANDNKGKYPDDLYQLIEAGYLDSPQLFITANSGNDLPADWARMTPAQKRAWVAEESDVVYVGKGMTAQRVKVSHETPVAYSRSAADDGWIAVTYADGHVKRQPYADAMELIRKHTNEK